MTQSTKQTRNAESGFTLVELAIVMIIIGLLIGGILKGQELIGAARVASAVSQIKAAEVGINTFRDKYSGYPGDILTPATRVPNCTAAVAPMCAQAGNANSQIGAAGAGGALATAANENSAALAQMVAADMYAGVRPSVATGTASAPEINLVASNLAGSYKLMYDAGSTPTGAQGPLAAGHYLRWDTSTTGAGAAGDVMLTPSQALRVDKKIDNDSATTGSVIAIGGAAGTATCNTTAGVYNELLGGNLCGLYIRVNQ